MLHIILYIKNPVLKRRDVRQYGKLYVKNCNHRLQQRELRQPVSVRCRRLGCRRQTGQKRMCETENLCYNNEAN